MKKTRIHDAGLGPGASSFFSCMTAEERELLTKIRNKKYHTKAKYLADQFFAEKAQDTSL